MTKKLWNKFIQYGSGFVIEAERDYKQKGEPLIYHLRCFGLLYPDNFELVGEDLEKLLKEAIKVAEKFKSILN